MSAESSKIIRAIARSLSPYGFVHTKPTFICKRDECYVYFFHIHKYSGTNSFRIHAGIRPLNSRMNVQHLNGIDFDHLGNWESTEEGRTAYGKKITDWCIKQGLAWFTHWQDTEKLLKSPDSPLHEKDKQALKEGLTKGIERKNLTQSLRLFGLDKN